MGLNSRDSDYKKCLICGKTNCICNIIKTEERFDYIKKEEMKFYEKIDHICPDCGKLKCTCDIIEIKNKCPKCLKYGCNGECLDVLKYDLKSREILELLSLLEGINKKIMSGEEIVGLGNYIVSIGESNEDFGIFIKENSEYFDIVNQPAIKENSEYFDIVNQPAIKENGGYFNSTNILNLSDKCNKLINIFFPLNEVINKLELKNIELLLLVAKLRLILKKKLNLLNQDNIKGVLIHIGKEIIILGNEIRSLEINKIELEIKSGKY